jgi:hypothetical protein
VFHCPVTGKNPAIICAKLTPASNFNLAAKTGSTAPTLAKNVGGAFNATFNTPGTTGGFSIVVDGTGVGSYSWDFNLTGIIPSDQVTDILTNGIKCELLIS